MEVTASLTVVAASLTAVTAVAAIRRGALARLRGVRRLAGLRLAELRFAELRLAVLFFAARFLALARPALLAAALRLAVLTRRRAPLTFAATFLRALVRFPPRFALLREPEEDFFRLAAITSNSPLSSLSRYASCYVSGEFRRRASKCHQLPTRDTKSGLLAPRSS
jgi:hypothetical protein